ncbi:MAG: PaaI family thioesterase [Actinomycetales bacterium]
MTIAELSLQERFFPTSTCFGCGPGNPAGLHLRSFPNGSSDTATARCVARFTTTPSHDNGLGYVNGGIIATLLDCHSAGSALLKAEQLAWGTAEGAAYPCVTAGLDLRYLRPTPLCQELSLDAYVTEFSDDEICVLSMLTFEGKVRAEGLVRWRRWRPRQVDSSVSQS